VIEIATRLNVLPHSRLGARPLMERVLPHVQLNQLPSSSDMEELVDRCLEIPRVRSKQSRMASPGSHALYLADAFAAGPPAAFIDGNEFCHIHPLPHGNIHLTLPRNLRDEVLRLGWGEPHPIANSGILTTLVTLYAPRDREDLGMILFLIVRSCEFALGKLRGGQTGERSLRESP
jgi:hypothetical protein